MTLYWKKMTASVLFVAAIPFLMFTIFGHDKNKLAFNRELSKTTLKIKNRKQIDFHPVSIKVFNSKLYAYNFEGGQLIEFDNDLNFTRSIGKPGKGINDFQILSDYYIVNDTLVCLDMRSKMFLQFDLKSLNLLNSHKINNSFSRGLIIDTRQYLLSEVDHLKLMFNVYDNHGKFLYNIPNPYKDLDDGGFAADGFFIKGNEAFYYACFHLSNLFSFTQSSGKIREGHTIENFFDKPEILTDGEAKYLSPSSITLSYEGCADDKYLYILSSGRADNEFSNISSKRSPVDVYDSKTLTYLSTMYIDSYDGHKVSSIFKINSGFYAIQGNNILFYEEDSL